MRLFYLCICVYLERGQKRAKNEQQQCAEKSKQSDAGVNPGVVQITHQPTLQISDGSFAPHVAQFLQQRFLFYQFSK